MKDARIVAALLVTALLLTGCALPETLPESDGHIRYSDMEYVRPDMTQMEQALEKTISLAQGKTTEQNLSEIMDGVYGFYEAYDWFYTAYALADLGTSHDLTDIYWEAEYAWCMEHSAETEALLEQLYRGLARSPCREALEEDAYFGADFFNGYDGESTYEEEFLALLEEEAALQSRFYELSAITYEEEYGTDAYYDACSGDLMDLLLELIALRQEIAAYWGYEDYAAFANDFYYYRDYTPEQTESYLQQVAEHLVPLYRDLDFEKFWGLSDRYCEEKQTFGFVRDMAKAMGGKIWESFYRMEQGGLYDLEFGENKYSTSYEIYLPSYYTPFIFLSPELSRYDCLTFAHEFGHYCNDDACFGSYSSVDMAEVFSQGMEYLSLCYGEDTVDLTGIKMADSLSLFVEQSAFASFEQQMYGLKGEQLTQESLCSLYESVALEYGFDSVGFDRREFVTIGHFYTNPMYIQSYVFSNDAAMQLYQLELEEAGAGLALYQRNLDSAALWFLESLETMGLESPFRPGRVEELAKIFEKQLG